MKGIVPTRAAQFTAKLVQLKDEAKVTIPPAIDNPNPVETENGKTYEDAKPDGHTYTVTFASKYDEDVAVTDTAKAGENQAADATTNRTWAAAGSIAEPIAHGTYRLSVSASGYATYYQTIKIEDNQRLDITLYNSVTVNNSKKDATNTKNFGVIPFGDLNGDNKVDDEDANLIVDTISSDSHVASADTTVQTDSPSHDINGDGTVDSTDVSLVVRNNGECVAATPVTSKSSYALKAATAEIDEKTTTVAVKGVDSSDNGADSVAAALLSPNSNSNVALQSAQKGENGEPLDIGPNNPVELGIDLTGNKSPEPAKIGLFSRILSAISGEEPKVDENKGSEGMTIAPPVGSQNYITDGVIGIVVEGENGEEKTYEAVVGKGNNTSGSAPEENAVAAAVDEGYDASVEGVSVESDGTIVIDIGTRVAVKRVKIKVTGSKSGKLAEIAKVDFLDDFGSRVPEPQTSIPTVSSVVSGEADGLGYRTVTVTWSSEPNVTGYEVTISGTGYNKSKIVNNPAVVDGKCSTDFIGDSFNGTVTAFNKYNVKVRSLNGDWKSEWSANFEHEVTTTKVPNKPEQLTAKSAINKVTFSWRALWDTNRWVAYVAEIPAGSNADALKARVQEYRDKVNGEKKGEEPTANDIPDFTKYELKTNSLTLSALVEQDKVKAGSEYLIYVAGGNKNGYSSLSTDSAIGQVQKNTVAKMPQYKLLNTPVTVYDAEGNEIKDVYANHIKKIEFVKESQKDFSGGVVGKTNAEDEETIGNLALVDNSVESSFKKIQWFNDAFTVTFDDDYQINKIRLSYDSKSSFYYWVREYGAGVTYEYKDINGDNGKASVLYTMSLKTDDEGKKWMELTFDTPVTGHSFTLRIVAGYPSADNPLVIDEARFYYYDSLEDDTAALFSDDMRTVLKNNVTEEKIAELEKRANTVDKASGEYNPNRETVLADLEYAKQLLKDGAKTASLFKVNSSITAQADNGNPQQFAQSLSDFQPLGRVAAEGDTVVLYVSRPGLSRGSATNLYLVFTQYHPECSAWKTETTRLYAGRNEITVSDVASPARENGGAMYLRYCGQKNKEEYTVRVASGTTEIPMLNVNGLAGTARKDALEAYVKALETYVKTLNELENEVTGQAEETKTNTVKHMQAHGYSKVTDKDVKNQTDNTEPDKKINRNVNYAYDKTQCFLNSTEIVSTSIFYSLPATEIYKALAGDKYSKKENLSDTEVTELATKLGDALTAMEEQITYFYQFRGMSRMSGVSSVDRYPSTKLNIRYCVMFTGAFMYAAGKHIGIEFGSTGSVIGMEPFNTTTGDSTTFNAEKGHYAGWGIAHEIGHCINNSQWQRVEVTNNIFAQLAQSIKDENNFRTAWQNVYDGVASGSVGHTGNLAVQLGMYWQLHLAYDENPLSKLYKNAEEAQENLFYARVDAYYRDPTRATKDGKALEIPLDLKNGDADQKFMRVACAAAEKNILDFFKAWGFTANEETVAFAKQFEDEERPIQYINSAAHITMIDKNGAGSKVTVNGSSKVTANFAENQDIKNNRINSNTVTIEMSVSKNGSDDKASYEDGVLGYEVKRDGKVVAFLDASDPSNWKDYDPSQKEPNGDKTVIVYKDIVSSENNKAFVYSVTAYSLKMEKIGNECVLTELKVAHDGAIAKDGWTITTNMTSPHDVTINPAEEEKTEADKVDSSSDNVGTNNRPQTSTSVWSPISDALMDNDTGTFFLGSQPNGSRPQICIDLGKIEQISALKYTPIKQPNAATATSTGPDGEEYSYTTTLRALANCRPVQYRIEISTDGVNWQTVKQDNTYPGCAINGSLANVEAKLNQKAGVVLEETTTHDGSVTYYFSKMKDDGNMDPYMYTYDARFVRFTATDMSVMGISDIQILAPTSDNVDIGAIGTLETAFDTGATVPGEDHTLVIPKDSYVFYGTYKGDPSYSVVELRDQNGVILGGEQVILANVCDGMLGETSDGMWIFWMTGDNLSPEEKEYLKENNITNVNTYKDQMSNVTSIQAELYRVNDAFSLEGERMTSNSLHFTIDQTTLNNNIKINKGDYTGAGEGEASQPSQVMLNEARAIATAASESSTDSAAAPATISTLSVGSSAPKFALTAAASADNTVSDDEAAEPETTEPETTTTETTTPGTTDEETKEGYAGKPLFTMESQQYLDKKGEDGITIQGKSGSNATFTLDFAGTQKDANGTGAQSGAGAITVIRISPAPTNAPTVEVKCGEDGNVYTKSFYAYDAANGDGIITVYAVAKKGMMEDSGNNAVTGTVTLTFADNEDSKTTIPGYTLNANVVKINADCKPVADDVFKTSESTIMEYAHYWIDRTRTHDGSCATGDKATYQSVCAICGAVKTETEDVDHSWAVKGNTYVCAICGQPHEEGLADNGLTIGDNGEILRHGVYKVGDNYLFYDEGAKLVTESGLVYDYGNQEFYYVTAGDEGSGTKGKGYLALSTQITVDLHTLVNKKVRVKSGSGAEAETHKLILDLLQERGFITETEKNEANTKSKTVTFLFGPAGRLLGKVLQTTVTPNDNCVNHYNDPETGICPTCGLPYDGFTQVTSFTTEAGKSALTIVFSVNAENVKDSTKVKWGFYDSEEKLAAAKADDLENSLSITKVTPEESDENEAKKDTNVSVTGVTTGSDVVKFTLVIELSAKDIRKFMYITLADYAYGISGNPIQDPDYRFSIAQVLGDVSGGEDEELSEVQKNLNDALNFYLNVLADYNDGDSNVSVEGAEALAKVTSNDLKPFKASTSGKLPSGITYVGSTVNLKKPETIEIIHKFKVTKAAIAKKYGLVKNGSYYELKVECQLTDYANPKANTVTVGSWKLNYSVLSYAYSVLTSSSTDDELKNLVKALYLYHSAFVAYDEAKNGNGED